MTYGLNLGMESIGSTNINLGSDLPKEKIIFADQLPYMEEIFDSQLNAFGKSPALNQDSLNTFLNIIAPETSSAINHWFNQYFRCSMVKEKY